MELRFPHFCNMLKQFDLEGCGPHSASRPELMEGVVVGDVGGEAVIEYHYHRLPHHIHKTYAALFPSPFRD